MGAIRSKWNSYPRLSCLGLVLMLLSLTLVWADTSLAASLWQDNQGSLFTDSKARNVGDLVTIIIVERTQASQVGRDIHW